MQKQGQSLNLKYMHFMENSFGWDTNIHFYKGIFQLSLTRMVLATCLWNGLGRKLVNKGAKQGEWSSVLEPSTAHTPLTFMVGQHAWGIFTSISPSPIRHQEDQSAAGPYAMKLLSQLCTKCTFHQGTNCHQMRGDLNLSGDRCYFLHIERSCPYSSLNVYYFFNLLKWILLSFLLLDKNK